MNITRQLRSINFSIELDYSGSSFSKQFKRADKSGAKWAMVIGENEVLEGQLKVKKLRDIEDKDGIKEYIFLTAQLDKLVSRLRE